MIKKRIFLAHSEKDYRLVECLKNLLVKTLDLTPKEIFISSDPTTNSIKSYEKFPDAITNALREANAVIVLLTPNSVFSPWVHFEAGGGHFAKNKSLFVVCAFGIQPDSLPDNLLFYSCKDLSNENSVTQFLKDLKSTIGSVSSPKILPDVMGELTALAGRGSRGWNLVHQTLISEETSGSPFAFTELLSEAKKEVFVAGQILFSFTLGADASRIKEEVFRFLKEDDQREVKLLLQENREPWNTLIQGFGKDLPKSIDKFNLWLSEAENLNINSKDVRRLDIRVTKIVPVTFTFIDPDLPNGKMVFTPVLYRAPQTGLRPAVFLSGGKTNKIYKYYWDIWKLCFNEAIKIGPASSTGR